MDDLFQKLFDAYETLGVHVDSPLAEVTRAYRRLAKRFHPDSSKTDPETAQEKMTKINAAYATIKECRAKGIEISYHVEKKKTSYRKQGQAAQEAPEEDHSLWAWLRRYDKEKKRKEEREKRERERRRREKDAQDKFWEKVVLERKWEIEDRKSYDIILKYTQALIAFFYKMNFHNAVVRDRPLIQKEFDGFISIYRQKLRRISSLKGSSRSAFYREKSSHAHAFLKSFIDDSLRPSLFDIERRASALDIFQKADRFSERFMQTYFSSDGVTKEEALRMFRKSLNFFEVFVKAYPESPLVEYASSRVEVLDKMYRAFLRWR